MERKQLNPRDLRRVHTVSGDVYEIKATDKVSFFEQVIEVRRVVGDYTKVYIFPIHQVTTTVFEEDHDDE